MVKTSVSKMMKNRRRVGPLVEKDLNYYVRIKLFCPYSSDVVKTVLNRRRFLNGDVC